MRQWLHAAAITAAILITASTVVFAQYETDNKSRFGLRMSVYRPSSSSLTDLSGIWYGPTIDYNIKFDKNDRPSLIASYTMLGQEKGSIKANLTPLTLNYIKHFAKDKSSNGWYAGGGLGYYTFSYDLAWAGNVRAGAKKVGISLVGGYEIGESYFVELKYDKVGSIYNLAQNDDISFDGLTLSLGTRVAY
ncbi:MAG: hypothetical protein NT018_09915 [Armatimonadetes bacterium]|nr:hypothetical protein [Armatimonadota bacterium]